MLGNESMLDYFFKQGIFEIPLYQRSYNWGRNNCETLFDDLVDIFKMSEIINSEIKYKKHFFGIVLCLRDLYSGDRTIIDGQQRVTSVALLLAAIRDALLDGLIESSNNNLSEQIDRKLKDQDDDTIFIRHTEKDRPIYEAIIYRDPIPDEYETSNFVSNYDYFKKRILGLKDMTIDQFMDCLSRLYIVPIHLNNTDDDAQKVFESINSTGLDLTEGDKVRNYMLMNHSPKDQEKYYKRYWTKIDDGSFDMTRLVRSYLTAVTGNRPSMYEVYDEFKKYTKFLRTTEESFIELFEDMLKYTNYYKCIGNSDLSQVSDEASQIMYRINYHGAGVVYPFLMRVLDYHESGNLSDEEVVEVLGIVENYLLRRAICELRTQSVGYSFSNMFHTLIKDDSGSFADRLKYALLAKEGAPRYPRDEEVLYHLNETDLYFRRTACTHALAMIESANKDTEDTLKRIADGKLTVEHVMPQTLSKEWKEHLGENYKEIHKTWLHRLGNLTLTAYNTSYSNKPYEVKRNLERTGFVESRLHLDRMMAENETWTEELIEERNAYLAERFMDVMPEFTTAYEPPVTVGDSMEFSLSREDSEFFGIKVTGFVFDGEIHAAKSAMDAYIQILKILYNLDPVKFENIKNDKGPGRIGGWMTSDSVKAEEWGYIKILPDVWICKNMDNSTKVKFLRQILTFYGLEFDEVAFIARKK